MVQSVGDLAARMPSPHTLFGFGGGTIVGADICQLCWVVSLTLRAFLRVLQSFCLPKTNNSIDNFRVTSLSVKRLCITWRKGYSFISWHHLGYTVHWIICILLLFSHYQAQKDSPDIQWKVNWILYTVFLLTCLFKAWENSLHLATRPLVSPRKDAWETGAEIPYWWPVTTQIMVEADRLLDRLPDKRLDKLPDKLPDKLSDKPLDKVPDKLPDKLPNMGSDASSVLNSCIRFSDVISRENR